MLASVIIDHVAELLQDTDHDTWTEAQLIAWLNSAQRAVVVAQPTANVVVGNIDLTAGTKQTLPTGGIKLLSINRNMGTDGATPGRVVFLGDRVTLNSFYPGWHEETQVAEIKEYMLDDRENETFWVYPPADGTTKVEAEYSAVPAEISAVGDSISLPDAYEGAMSEWMLYRCFGRDSEETPNHARSLVHFQNFFNLLGVKVQNSMRVSPNRPENK